MIRVYSASWAKAVRAIFWVAVNYAADVYRQIKPFVRVERDRVCPLDASKQVSRRLREDSKGAIASVDMHPKLEAVRNLSDLS
jgi:hypothetical protein